MSRRFNKYGFSFGKMRQLFGSKDEVALAQLHKEISTRYGYRDANEQDAIVEIVDRAVMSGVPFPDLERESWLHHSAAVILALHGQEPLYNYSSLLEDAFALEDGLWGRYRKFANPETRAFLRGLIEGIPFFGRLAESENPYGAISLSRLRVVQPDLRELAELIVYRVKCKKSDEGDLHLAEFATAFSEWLNELIVAERDLFFSFG